MAKPDYQYEALHSQEDNGGSSGSVSSKDDVPLRTLPEKSPLSRALRHDDRCRHKLLLAVSSVMLFASVCLCLFSLSVLRRTPSELECAQVVSPYSPIWDVVEFWEGDFVNYFNASSIYRGPPMLEREEAWDALWKIHGVAVTRDGLKALNKSLEPGAYAETIHSDPKNPTYGAQIEAAHQLHCLNLIRQYTWPLKMYNETWDELYPHDLVEPVGARMHVDHCIETIRMSLMCYADITPVLVEITPERKAGSKADFNVHHKCRNYDKIRKHLLQQGVEINSTMHLPP